MTQDYCRRRMKLKGLLPVLIQTAAFDVPCEIDEACARRLDTAAKIGNSRYSDRGYECGLLDSSAHLPALNTAVHQTNLELKQHLNKRVEARYCRSTSRDTANLLKVATKASYFTHRKVN